mgnify:CR=1 FL=1
MKQKQINLSEIKNIIFDLGMVVVDLDQKATEKAFKNLMGNQYHDLITDLNHQKFFENYETGKLSSREFIRQLGTKIGGPAIDQKIISAWNAMLGEIPESRFQILKWAKKNYRTFCLSNTNELHISHLYNYLKKEKGIEDLEDYFEKVYLSHQIGMRKPEIEIFEFVLEQQQLKAEETLFIDDTAGHLEGAKKVGIKTFHLHQDTSLEKLFQPYLPML